MEAYGSKISYISRCTKLYFNVIETLIASTLAVLAGNGSVKKMGTDVVDTVVSTIRPWFLIDDDATAETKVTTAIEAVRAEAETPPATEAFIREQLRTALTGHPDRIQQLQNVISPQTNIQVNNEGATIKNQFTGGTFNNTNFN